MDRDLPFDLRVQPFRFTVEETRQEVVLLVKLQMLMFCKTHTTLAIYLVITWLVVCSFICVPQPHTRFRCNLKVYLCCLILRAVKTKRLLSNAFDSATG